MVGEESISSVGMITATGVGGIEARPVQALNGWHRLRIVNITNER